MKPIRDFIQWLKPTSIFLFMEIVNVFFPYYPAFIVILARRARAIVYGRWILYKPERFFNYLAPYVGEIVNIKIDSKYAIIDIRKRRGKDIYTIYLANIKQFKNDTYLIRKYNLIRYYFYYVFVWIWLDDLNNVAGYHKGVLKNSDTPIYHKYIRLPIYKRIQLVENIKYYDSIFSKEYQDLDKEVQLNKFKNRLWFVKYQYTYNYLRDKCVKTTYSNTYGLGSKNGFIYHTALDRSCLVIFGYNVITRRKV